MSLQNLPGLHRTPWLVPMVPIASCLTYVCHGFVIFMKYYHIILIIVSQNGFVSSPLYTSNSCWGLI